MNKDGSDTSSKEGRHWRFAQFQNFNSMKTKTTPLSLFHRSLLALSLGAALASLPVSVRAQEASPSDAPSTGGPATMVQPTPPPKEAVTEGKLSVSDKALIRKFANGNEAEVEMAKLAMTNADSQEVKDFAQKMIDDHGKANDQLKEIATAHGVGDKPQLDQSNKAAYEKMKQLKGKNFDSAYINHAVADHEADVKEYTKAKKDIKDEKLMAYANDTLPIIEGHLKMAKELKMGKGSAKKES